MRLVKWVCVSFYHSNAIHDCVMMEEACVDADLMELPWLVKHIHARNDSRWRDVRGLNAYRVDEGYACTAGMHVFTMKYHELNIRVLVLHTTTNGKHMCACVVKKKKHVYKHRVHIRICTHTKCLQQSVCTC